MSNSPFESQSVSKAYFSLSLPVVFGMVVTIFYNITDTYFIALTQNTALVAGVSLCAPVFTLLMAFGNIFGQGGSSLISRLLGENRQDDLKRVSSFCFYIAILFGAVFGGIMLLLRGPLLALLLSVSRQGVVFVAVLFLGVRLAGYTGIVFAQPVADVVSAVLTAALLKGAFREDDALRL